MPKNCCKCPSHHPGASGNILSALCAKHRLYKASGGLCICGENQTAKRFGDDKYGQPMVWSASKYLEVLRCSLGYHGFETISPPGPRLWYMAITTQSDKNNLKIFKNTLGKRNNMTWHAPPCGMIQNCLFSFVMGLDALPILYWLLQFDALSSPHTINKHTQHHQNVNSQQIFTKKQSAVNIPSHWAPQNRNTNTPL